MRPDVIGTRKEVAPPGRDDGGPPGALPRQAPGSDAPRHVAGIRPPPVRDVLHAAQAAAGPRPFLEVLTRPCRPRLRPGAARDARARSNPGAGPALPAHVSGTPQP